MVKEEQVKALLAESLVRDVRISAEDNVTLTRVGPGTPM